MKKRFGEAARAGINTRAGVSTQAGVDTRAGVGTQAGVKTQAGKKTFAGVVGVFLCLGATLALVSFSAQDSSLTHAGNTHVGQKNLLGWWGATFAEIAFQLLGWLIIPLLVLGWLWSVRRLGVLPQGRLVDVLQRWCGIFFLLLGFGGMGIGGIVGQNFYEVVGWGVLVWLVLGSIFLVSSFWRGGFWFLSQLKSLPKPKFRLKFPSLALRPDALHPDAERPDALRPKPRTTKRQRLGSFSHRFSHRFSSKKLPDLSLLRSEGRTSQISDRDIQRQARELEAVLGEFGVEGRIVHARAGPVVIVYEFTPAPGVKTSRVMGLSEDIARSLGATGARIAVSPGQKVIGIEVPNPIKKTVFLKPLLEETHAPGAAQAALPLALGRSLDGSPYVSDLALMPHLLMAGTTGSGKSVALHAMILCLLYRLSPAACRLMMIDPKRLELSVYEEIPHLLTPVVTAPKEAVLALRWLAQEMERRYEQMAQAGARHLSAYNARSPNPLPFIVVIIDEMADLMLAVGKEFEVEVQRLAQMARAAGIHLIAATQRPSVDVITGTIKANFPTRIAFQVSSRIDSRTILGEGGAEQLLGQGDMLFLSPGGGVERLQGPFVSEEEVFSVTEFLRQTAPPNYAIKTFVAKELLATADDAQGEELYAQARALITQERRASTSYLQRRLQIGYNRAARLMERMEAEGLVTPPNMAGKREVCVD